MIRRTVQYAGRVQGVGFRLTTTQIARSYRVSGYVENLADGRVEAVVEGESPEVERFLDAVAAEMSPNIRETTWKDSAPTHEFSRFEIRR